MIKIVSWHLNVKSCNIPFFTRKTTVLKRRFNEQLEILMKGIFYMSILQNYDFDCRFVWA